MDPQMSHQTVFDGWTLISDVVPAAPKSSACQPLPVPQSRHVQRQYPGPELTLGGLPIPVPKVRAKSATVPLHVRVPPSGDTMVSGTADFLSSSSLQSNSTGLSLPLLPAGTSKRQPAKTSGQLLRLKHPSQSDWLVQQWSIILKDLGIFSTVATALQDSSHAPQHACSLIGPICTFNTAAVFSGLDQFFQDTQIIGFIIGHADRSTVGRCTGYYIAGQEFRLLTWMPVDD